MKKLCVYLFSLSLILVCQPAEATDTSAPILVDWSITNRVGDISSSDAKFSVKFMVSDDSQVDKPSLLLKSSTTSQITSFADVRETARSGKLISFEATATVVRGQAPKQWEWVLYPLKDNFGNTNNTFGPEPKWPKYVTVLDTKYSQSVLTCLQRVLVVNMWIQSWQSLKKTYPQSLEVDIFKLKYGIPDSTFNDLACENNPNVALEIYARTDGNSIPDLLYDLSKELRAEAEYPKVIERFQVLMRETTQLNSSLSSFEPQLATFIKKNISYRNFNGPFLTLKRETLELYNSVQSALAGLPKEYPGISKTEELSTEAAVFNSKRLSLMTQLNNLQSKLPIETTITCVKGKLTKKVTAVNPKCPSGYKKK